VALRLAQRWATVERGARAGLRAGHAAGDRTMAGATRALRRAVSAELVPQWPRHAMPPAAPGRLPATRREGAAAVYFPACINRIFGYDRALSLPDALVALSARAGRPLWIPPDVAGRCCATPWHSKGYRAGAEHMARATRDALRRWSDDGRLPVVVDATSCTQGLLEADPGDVRVVDSLAWAAEELVPRLTVSRRVARAVVHPTCASRHLELDAALASVAAAIADEVVAPAAATCCGFAGDRGLLHPELVASALREEAAEVRAHPADAHLSSNRTCEIGLSQATGERYESFAFLLEEATR
jgi:D-lactate dehydrogenase